MKESGAFSEEDIHGFQSQNLVTVNFIFAKSLC